MNFEEAVVRAIKAERSASGMTVEELAKASGVPSRSLERYLNQERSMKVDVIYAIAGAFKMSGSQLFAEAERRMGRHVPADGPQRDAALAALNEALEAERRRLAGGGESATGTSDPEGSP